MVIIHKGMEYISQSKSNILSMAILDLGSEWNYESFFLGSSTNHFCKIVIKIFPYFSQFMFWIHIGQTSYTLFDNYIFISCMC